MNSRKNMDDPSAEIKIGKFRAYLLTWGKENIRNYPWRFSTDPYAVLVSEFMLHRTQTRQVVPIYQEFMHVFPTLADYAAADEETIFNILTHLGLRWRITGMMDALTELWKVYGEVPVGVEWLLGIHGIGQYIAGATFCFTQNLPITLIDNNIVRVVGRVFGLDLSGEARRRKTVIEGITRVCDPEDPRFFYYAMIDLAHILCRPTRPECDLCPLQNVPCIYGKLHLGERHRPKHHIR
jgi:A/G-specific adenine glycosylase